MKMDTNPLSAGQIITFYSYKGGTGRSMALANTACLLSQKWIKNEKVLMIDWDLEAPGLPQFFRGKIRGIAGSEFPKEQLGLIDLFSFMKLRATELSLDDESVDDSFFDEINIEKYILETTISSLYLMPAGSNKDGLYSSRVNSFDWNELFNHYPSMILKFAEYLRRRFRYVLIDSRTGDTDISGICTTLMPERLVVVFTPNRQSLTGALSLVRKSVDYRKQSDDLRQLLVFPLVSRIEPAEPELRIDWRFGNNEKEILGFQSQFEGVFKEVYHLETCDLTSYFDDVQIQHIPRYAYGEEIAMLTERSDDRLSVARSYENFVQRLVLLDGPWDDLKRVILKQTNVSNINSSLIQGNEFTLNFEEDVKQRPLRVFLAHSAGDKSAVRQLQKKLLSQSWIDPWLDEDKLLPGQKWRDEISNAIRESDIVVVCLSQDSVTKEGYVQKELKYALDLALEKPEDSLFIIPIRLNDCDVPSRLHSWQWVDYFPESHQVEAYERLLRGLELRAEKLGIKDVSNKITINDIEFIRIPRGQFVMGSNISKGLADNEQPQHVLNIPYDYWIGRFPVTNAQFLNFIERGSYKFERLETLQRNLNHPVVGVTWGDACAFCNWLNRSHREALSSNEIFRLPTEAEWERSARGNDSRDYPWGNAFDKNKANVGLSSKYSTTPVDSYPQGVSPYGVADMVGNVWEWTHSLNMTYPYSLDDGREDEIIKGRRVLRGGSYSNRIYARVSSRHDADQDYFDVNVSFRVAIGPPLIKL